MSSFKIPVGKGFIEVVNFAAFAASQNTGRERVAKESQQESLFWDFETAQNRHFSRENDDNPLIIHWNMRYTISWKFPMSWGYPKSSNMFRRF